MIQTNIQMTDPLAVNQAALPRDASPRLAESFIDDTMTRTSAVEFSQHYHSKASSRDALWLSGVKDLSPVKWEFRAQ